jgi:hypothetical protein
MKRRNWKLAHSAFKPSIAEVRDEIEDTLESMAQSHREADGVVRDEGAILAIAAYRRALELLPKE